MQATVNQTSYQTQVKRTKRKSLAAHITAQTVLYIILTICAICSVFPFIFMILSSLMTDLEYRTFTEITDMIPETLQWSNYVDAFTYTSSGGGSFSTAIVNTILVAITSTGLGLLVTIFTAYAFARLEFKGKNLLFTLLLATMMIPGELYTITNFVTISDMNLRNTLTALILPFMISVYYIYLLRNTFKQVPDELYKAAKIDGVSDFKYLFKVMVPLASPTLISILLLKIIGVWNSYIWPQLVNKNKAYQLISNWMSSSGYPASGDSSNIVVPIRMAASVITTIPLLILFFCFRKYIMRGVSRSGIKG